MTMHKHRPRWVQTLINIIVACLITLPFSGGCSAAAERQDYKTGQQLPGGLEVRQYLGHMPNDSWTQVYEVCDRAENTLLQMYHRYSKPPTFRPLHDADGYAKTCTPGLTDFVSKLGAQR